MGGYATKAEYTSDALSPHAFKSLRKVNPFVLASRPKSTLVQNVVCNELQKYHTSRTILSNALDDCCQSPVNDASPHLRSRTGFRSDPHLPSPYANIESTYTRSSRNENLLTYNVLGKHQPSTGSVSMDGRIHSTNGHLQDNGRCTSMIPNVGRLFQIASSLRGKHVLVLVLALL